MFVYVAKQDKMHLQSEFPSWLLMQSVSLQTNLFNQILSFIQIQKETDSELFSCMIFLCHASSLHLKKNSLVQSQNICIDQN